VNVILAFLDQEEDEAESPFNRFTDLSRLDAIDLDVNTMIRISTYRRITYGKYPPVKSAFYVTTEGAAELVKIHFLLTSHSPLKVKLFREVKAAAEWLDVSPELLRLDAPPKDTGAASPNR
jgi:hypothetical protein